MAAAQGHQSINWVLASERLQFREFAQQCADDLADFEAHVAAEGGPPPSEVLPEGVQRKGVGGPFGYQRGPQSSRMADVARLGSVLRTVWLLAHCAPDQQAAYNPVGAVYAAACAGKHLVLRMLLAAPGPDGQSVLVPARSVWRGVLASGDITSMRWVLAALVAQEGPSAKLPLGQLRRAVIASLRARRAPELLEHWTCSDGGGGLKRSEGKLQFTKQQWCKILASTQCSSAQREGVYRILLDPASHRLVTPPQVTPPLQGQCRLVAERVHDILETAVTRVLSMLGLRPAYTLEVANATSEMDSDMLYGDHCPTVFRGDKLAWLEAEHDTMMAWYHEGSVTLLDVLRHSACAGMLDAFAQFAQNLRGGSTPPRYLAHSSAVKAWMVRFALNRRHGAQRAHGVFQLGSDAALGPDDPMQALLVRAATLALPEHVVLQAGTQQSPTLMPAVLLVLALSAGVPEAILPLGSASSHPAFHASSTAEGSPFLGPMVAAAVVRDNQPRQQPALCTFLQWMSSQRLWGGRHISVLDAPEGPVMHHKWPKLQYRALPDASSMFRRTHSQASHQQEASMQQQLLAGGGEIAQRHSLQPHPLLRQVLLLILQLRSPWLHYELNPEGQLRSFDADKRTRWFDTKRYFMTPGQLQIVMHLLQLAFLDAGCGHEVGSRLPSDSLRFRGVQDVWREAQAYIPEEALPEGDIRRQFRLWKSQQHPLRRGVVLHRLWLRRHASGLK